MDLLPGNHRYNFKSKIRPFGQQGNEAVKLRQVKRPPFDAFVKNEKGKERPATERQKRQEKCHTLYGKTEADYLYYL